jgi:flagellar motor switch protein FliN/FliY
MEKIAKKNPPQLVELPELSEPQGPPAGPPVIEAHFGLIRSVKVKLSVNLGGAVLTVGDLGALKDGSVLKLDRAAGEPVDVVLEGQVIARGRLVAVDDNFGVVITEIASGPRP